MSSDTESEPESGVPRTAPDAPIPGGVISERIRSFVSFHGEHPDVLREIDALDVVGTVRTIEAFVSRFPPDLLLDDEVAVDIALMNIRSTLNRIRSVLDEISHESGQHQLRWFAALRSPDHPHLFAKLRVCVHTLTARFGLFTLIAEGTYGSFRLPPSGQREHS